MLEKLSALIEKDGSQEVESLNKTNTKELQRALNLLGYEAGKVDGLYNERTKVAYEGYKLDHYLGKLELIGTGTLRMLKDDIAVAQNEKEETAPPEETPSSPVKYSSDDVIILAKTIYGEARGEKHEGRVAVGWTVINRVLKDSWWGKSVTQCCLHPWQFSCWNDNDPNSGVLKALRPDTGNHVFEECINVAKKILDGSVSDPTDGATHYYATYIYPPKWTKGATVTTTIGVHRFYKDVK